MSQAEHTADRHPVFVQPDTAAELEREAKLNTALAKAQGAFENVKKDEKADAGSFSYQYASLAQVIATIRKPLADNGLALIQLPGGVGLHTELRHAEGGSIASVWPWPSVPENIQAYGKLVSYMRRYAILCLLGLATEDDDGAQASEKQPKASKGDQAAIAEGLRKLEAEAPQAEGQLPWVEQLRQEFKIRSRSELTAEQAKSVLKWIDDRRKDASIPFG